MKKKILFLLLFVFAFQMVSAQTKIVELSSPGTLKEKIGNEKASIVNLVVYGEMGDSDFKFLKSISNLETLDLSNVDLVAQKGFIVFPSLPKLKRISIPREHYWLSSKSIPLSSFVNGQNIDIGFIDIDTVAIDIKRSSVSNLIDEYLLVPVLMPRMTTDPKSGVVKESGEIGYNLGAFQNARYVKHDGVIYLDYSNKNPLQNGWDGVQGVPLVHSVLRDEIQPEGVVYLPDCEIVEGAIKKDDGKIGFFSCTEIQKVVFSSKIRRIGSGAFRGCHNLEEVVFPAGSHVVIEAYAFEDCPSLKRIVFEGDVSFESYALCGNTWDNIEIKGEAWLKSQAIKNANIVVFNNVPQLMPNRDILNDKQRNIFVSSTLIKVPEGKMDEFAKLGFPSSVLFDGEPNLEYSITLEKGGTILEKIPVNKLNMISSLTITGILYETDFDIIKQCKNLRYLDLSHTYSTFSEQLRKQKKADAQFVSGLFQMLGKTGEAQYKNGEISTIDNLQVQVFAKMAKEEAAQVEAGLDDCVIPQFAFYKMAKLEDVKLPYRATKISKGAFWGCTNLKKVEMPLFLKYIERGAFEYCGNLQDLHIPPTIKALGDHIFYGCTSLKSMDFSSCNITSNHYFPYSTFDGCGLKELKLPQGLTDLDTHRERETLGGIHYLDRGSKSLRHNMTIYFPKTFVGREGGSFTDSELHLSSMYPPNIDCKNCVIYIPKGAMTAFYSKFNSNGNRLVEE